MALAGTGFGVLAVAGWWMRREWQRSADRKQRARHAAERTKAADLRDCRVAHESLVADPAEREAGDPAAAGASPEPGRRRAEQRWQHAYSTASKLDPDLPVRQGGGS